MKKTAQSQSKDIQKITYVGMGVNVGLAILKVVFGTLVNSVALLADGIHSLSDLATDIAVLVGIHFGSKEPDHEHPYGHGRIETFSAAFVALVLVLIGGGMIFKASMGIARMPDDVQQYSSLFGMVVIWISLISVVAKELIYRWTRNIAVRTHSAALYANAWHHRSDALSSIAVLIGAVAVLFGYPHGDRIAAIAVGLMIILVGVKVVNGCLNELTERSVDRKTVERIEKIIASEKQILDWHKLRTRSLGREVFVDLHVLVNPDLTVTEAHEIADCLECSLHEQISRPINVMVHVEPKLY
ncbi:MAG: cation diffusion facilitator family transporter [Planctomycetota bacterium]